MKKFIAIFSTLLILVGSFMTVSAAVINAEDQVHMSFDKPVLNSTAKKIEIEDYVDIVGKTPGNGVRPIPEGAEIMMWQNNPETGDPTTAYLAFDIIIEKEGTYEFIIIGTAVQAEPALGQRGIAWKLGENGQKYQVDIFPILSTSYTYDNVGFRLGYISKIYYDLKPGTHKFYTMFHESYLQGGRLNLDGFYIQQVEKVVETTAPVTTVATTTTAKVTTNGQVTAPPTSDMTVYLVAALVASVSVALVVRRKAVR